MAPTSRPSGRNRPQRRADPHDRPTPDGGTGCHPGCGPPRHRGGGSFSPSWARPLRRGPRLAHDIVAVTPVVGTLIILAISSVGIAAVMTWGLPNVQQTQAVTELNGVLNQFYAIDHIADNVMHGGAIDKASEGNLNIPKGQVELTNGTLFVVTWFPNHTGRDDRFWITGLNDDSPESFQVHAADSAAASGDFVHVVRAQGSVVTPLSADTGTVGGAGRLSNFVSGRDTIAVELGTRPLEDRPTRVRVIEKGGDQDEGPFLMEAWILPSGSLHYVRHTNFGLAGFRLENSVVVSEMETGNTLRSQPLGTIERDASENPVFLGLFQMILIDDENRPGVQAAGAGSYPLLFALKANNLRADGLGTEAVHVDAIGVRADLWERHYINSMGFVALADVANDHPSANPPGVILKATVLPGPSVLHDAFDFVLLESLIGVSLQLETADLGTGV